MACRSFACTQAVLALMCGAPADDIRMAAAAVAQLIEGRERWLPALVEVAEAARGVWVCGPAERFGSAQQSALMLREGPRIIADACETGDWLHVDVYLTKPSGYALLLLGGSRYDAEVAGWRRERDFRLVSVGRELAGADAAITIRRCRAAGGGGDRRDGRGGAAGGRAVAEEPDLTRGGLAPGPDGRERCWWGVSTPDYMAYHDGEWGRPVTDDQGIYERLTLEAFQSGLSWLTILRKRENFRAAFAGFEIERGGGLRRRRRGAADGRRRDRAQPAQGRRPRSPTRGRRGQCWRPASPWPSWCGRTARDGGAAPGSAAELPATTDQSKALARELKRRGFAFVGPTTVYSTMQACGVVNDHLAGCWVRREVELLRR